MQIAKKELQASREKGFITLWPVAAGYRIEDGVVIREGNPLRRGYPLMSHPELPAEISKLQRGDEMRLLHFLKIYGELGYVKFTDRRNKKIKGDPIAWIWTHAQTLHFCLELLNGLKSKDKKLITTVLRAGRYRGQTSEMILVAMGAKFKDLPILPKKLITEGGPLEYAEKLLCDLINSNLINVRPKIYREEEGPHLRFTIGTLIEAAYWLLANDYVGGWLKRCEAPNCGSLFLQTDKRQTFCPKGLRQESLCASRVRLQRFRDSKK
ncbi:MAG TPA: hypothetical protein DD706_24585 [Nitrospiraceae bacterium]|nr:hypothetical protein [Nitrospiraceae bacterium]